jgi:GntR family transcriptional regulator
LILENNMVKKLPKHLKVKEDIKSIIYSEGYEVGDRLSSELELCQKLNTSRVTIRRALSELQAEGAIKRKRGSGTVVLKKKQKYNYMLTNVGRLADQVCENCDISTKMVKITEKRAEKNVAEKLNIEEGDLLIQYERVRSIDGVPAVYSIDNVAKDRIPKNLVLESMGPSLRQAIGIDLSYSDSKLTPVKASSYICEVLSIPPETICLLLEEITYDTDNKPLDYSYEYYPEYLFNFNLLRYTKK